MVAPLPDPITLVELGAAAARSSPCSRRRFGPARARCSCTSSTSRRTRWSFRSARSERSTTSRSWGTGRRTRRACATRRASGRPTGRCSSLFLGSNIGNFDPPAAHEFLAEIRGCLRPGTRSLLGADLIKPESGAAARLRRPARRDRRVQQEPARADEHASCCADFDLSAFAHRAVWNPGDRRVEMHLVSKRAQTVRIPRADVVVGFRDGRVDLDGELLQVRRRRRSSPWARPPASSCASSGSSPTPGSR